MTRMLQDVAFKALGQILRCGGREKRALTLVPFVVVVVMAIGKKNHLGDLLLFHVIFLCLFT